MRTLTLFLLLACSSSAVCAEEFFAKVIVVLDGDTVLVLREGGGAVAGSPPASPLRGNRANALVKIRMAEIDAPEKDQEYGMASRQSLSELVLKKMVQVNSQAVDGYGRLVAHLVLDGRSINEEQVRRGMAWEYSNYHSNRTYIALQSEAQQAKRGLWAQAGPTPPWQWRKTHTVARNRRNMP